MTTTTQPIDIIVIGSGAAGLALALSLSSRYHVAVVTKHNLIAGSSPYAQGGIAAVLNQQEEDIQSHIHDTLTAGAGLCDLETVTLTVIEARDAIHWLIEQGVQFSLDPSKTHFHLTKEGGHSKRRILHVKDKTGAAIMATLQEQVIQHPNITCYQQHLVTDLITDNNRVMGLQAINHTATELISLHAHRVVIATGGASDLFQHTTHAEPATGDGIAMAWRAGCQINNMEFHQFHPTCFYNPGKKPFLITEALRGEGAILTLPSGKPFMADYDPRKELAPRDIVARAIDNEMKRYQIDHVLLNISHLKREKLNDLFPTIFSHCLSHGIDMSQQAIPVTPAAHYTCGGIHTDHNGLTTIEHLYAIGETACTGLHGANRLASNSLLECLVFASRASQHIQAQPLPSIQRENHSYHLTNTHPHYDALHTLRQQLKQIMWQHVGIVRKNESLHHAKQQLAELRQQASKHHDSHNPSKASTELFNLLDNAELTLSCCQQRHESRGLHYTLSYPDTQAIATPTLAQPRSDNIGT